MLALFVRLLGPFFRVQQLAADLECRGREAAFLGDVQEDASWPEHFPQDAVLFLEILDHSCCCRFIQPTKGNEQAGGLDTLGKWCLTIAPKSSALLSQTAPLFRQPRCNRHTHATALLPIRIKRSMDCCCYAEATARTCSHRPKRHVNQPRRGSMHCQIGRHFCAKA